MSFTGVFIQRPVMTTLVMIAILGAGLIGWSRLPISDLPKIDYPTISISASLPGADPETMAATVAVPLERQIAAVSGVDSLSSTSSQGTTQITVQFLLERDIDSAAQDIQAAISRALKQLPPEMTAPPTWQKVNPADLPILLIALHSSTLPMSQLNAYADTLIAQRLSMVNGVAQVSVFGNYKSAVRIKLDPDRLAGRNISIDEVASAVDHENSNHPLGTLWGANKTWTMHTNAGLKNADDFKVLTVAWRNGSPVKLSEVAKVIDGYQNVKTAAWFNDIRAIGLAIYRQPGSNTIAIVDAIRELLPEIRQRLPKQAELQTNIDRSLPIRASIAEVQFTLILTAVLVVLVIFVFLRRLSATLIPALSLPLSLIGTFAVLSAMNYSIDNISMVALVLVTGFVVDDAIVVLENIVRRMETGESAQQAALKGSQQIAFTVLSMTLSLMAVFIPVMFMSGVLGRLFQEFAVTVMVAIAISGFVSLTLIPMMCSRMLRPMPRHPGRLYQLGEHWFDAWKSWYAWTLDRALAHRRWVLATLIASFVLVWYLLGLVPRGMIPNEDIGQIRLQTEFAADSSFEDMVTKQCAVAAIVQKNAHIRSFLSSVGSSQSNQGTMFIRLKDAPERKAPPEMVIAQLRKELSGVVGVKISPQIIPPIRIGARLSKAQFQYTLQGTDTSELYAATNALMGRLDNVKEITDVSSDLQLDYPRVNIAIDRDRAASLGVSAKRIETTLGMAYGGRQISTIYTDADQFSVILEVDAAHQVNTAKLAELRIRPDLFPSNALVQLATIATITTGVGPISINHQGQLPAVTLAFNLRDGVSLGTAVDRIQACAAQVLPASVSGAFTGAAQAYQTSLASMGILLLLSIAVIYLVLGILYESFIHPLTILSGLPSAGIGALLALLIFRNELNVYSFIGIIMLVGIVKKNAIMMIDFAIEARKDR